MNIFNELSERSDWVESKADEASGVDCQLLTKCGAPIDGRAHGPVWYALNLNGASGCSLEGLELNDIEIYRLTKLDASKHQ